MNTSKEPRTAVFSYGCAEYNSYTLKERASQLFNLDKTVAIWYYLPHQDQMINMRIADLKAHHFVGASKIFIRDSKGNEPYQVFRTQGLYQGGGYWYGEKLSDLKQHIKEHYERRLAECQEKLLAME